MPFYSERGMPLLVSSDDLCCVRNQCYQVDGRAISKENEIGNKAFHRGTDSRFPFTG